MVERITFVEKLGFDWVSLSEHHYSPRILTPSPPVAAAYVASRVHKIKIALLGPIVSHSNPVRLAEELAMLDTMADGRLVVGLLRGTTNEALTYDLNPQESRERTDEGMELILKAWTEPQPFGWQGRHFRYRTVSVWPRPLQQPHPPTYALGTSREAGEFAARNRIGLGVSYGPFEVMGKATGFYREQCARHGWQPDADQIIFRANIVLAETDARRTGRWRRIPRGRRFRWVTASPGRCWNWIAATSPARRGRPASIARCQSISSADRIRSSRKSGPATRRPAPASSISASTRPAPPTRPRSWRRWTCSGAKCCREFAIFEGKPDRGGHRIGVSGRLGRGGRLPHPLSGGRRGAAAGSSARRGRLRLTPAHDLLSRSFRVIAFEMPGFGAAENQRTHTIQISRRRWRQRPRRWASTGST